MTIGQNIRACRKRRGLTQRELAALCGLSGGVISSYENGATTPRRKELERVARALEVPAERLAGGEAASPAPGAGDSALYGGILSLLRQLYGGVEGRAVLGEDGRCRRYYVVRQGSGSFVLYEEDIAALARSARDSMAPLAAHLRRARQAGA